MKTTSVSVSEEEHKLLKLLRKEIMYKGTDAFPEILQDYFKQHSSLSYGNMVGGCALYARYLLNPEDVIKDMGGDIDEYTKKKTRSVKKI